MTSTAGTSSKATAIKRQSSSAIAPKVMASMIRLSSITNSICTYSALTASVSLVMRPTNWPLIVRSK